MNTAHILLVDDDHALLEALSHTISLRMSGIHLQTATDASIALALLQEHDYDAIVSDIKMPGMDGLEMLHRITEQHPETPVLLITGHGEHNLAIQAIRGGAYDYILKPINRDDFIASLQRALHTRQLRRQVEMQQHALEWYALSLERRVEERTSELVSTNATKDALLHMVAHELATPLTSMKGLSQMIDRQLQRGDNLEKIRGTMGEMLHSMNRWELIVRDLQDTSLIQTHHFILHPRVSDLGELVGEILAEFTGGEGKAPIYEILDTLLQVDVDPERISQVVLNLLSNARKYSSPQAPIIVQVLQRERQAIVTIQDQGMGISKEQLSHITEPFYRAAGTDAQSDSPTGLGLGLYLAQTIVEQHAGHLEVCSQQGQGSTFSIILPLHT